MRLTTKGRYAVTSMLDLALHMHNAPVSLSDVAIRQGISLSYLEQLFAKLRKKGLVSSVRGPGGGYLLNKPAAEISISEVVDAVNEQIDATNCAGKGNCQQGSKCLTHNLWSDLSDQIHNFLSSITLASLMAREDVRKISFRQDEMIETADIV